MPNEMAAHLYKDGHVTHNWQQTQFLQDAFRAEDALREEVERYGQVRPKRNRMLDWHDSPESERSSARLSHNKKISSRRFHGDSGRKSSRSTSRSSCSTCSCGCSHTGRSSTRKPVASSRSSGRTHTCRSSMLSSECSSLCSCDCHSQSGWSDAMSTGRTSAMLTGRTDSTRRVDSLLARKRRLEAQLQALEEELQENDSVASAAASARSAMTSATTTGMSN